MDALFYASILLLLLNGETKQSEIVPAGNLEECIVLTKHLEKVYLPDPTVKVSLPQCDYRTAPK